MFLGQGIMDYSYDRRAEAEDPLRAKRLEAARHAILRTSPMDAKVLEAIAVAVVDSVESGAAVSTAFLALRKTKDVDLSTMHNDILLAYRSAKAVREKPRQRPSRKPNPEERFSVRILQRGSNAWAGARYSPTLKGALEEAVGTPYINDLVWAVFDKGRKIVDSRGWSGDVDFEVEHYRG